MEKRAFGIKVRSGAEKESVYVQIILDKLSLSGTVTSSGPYQGGLDGTTWGTPINYWHETPGATNASENPWTQALPPSLGIGLPAMR